MGDVEQFHLPPDAPTYTLHPCLVYAVGGIQHVQEGSAGIRGAQRRTRRLPASARKPLAGASATASHSGGGRAVPGPDRTGKGPVAAAKAADYAVGDVIDSRFEILQKLGQGGF